MAAHTTATGQGYIGELPLLGVKSGVDCIYGLSPVVPVARRPRFAEFSLLAGAWARFCRLAAAPRTLDGICIILCKPNKVLHFAISVPSHSGASDLRGAKVGQMVALPPPAAEEWGTVPPGDCLHSPFGYFPYLTFFFWER